MGYIELDVLDSSPKRVVIGIDLGTTNSLPAIWKDGRPEVLRIEGEAALVPSVVHVKDDGTAIVGRSARGRAARFSNRGLNIDRQKIAARRAARRPGSRSRLSGIAIAKR